MYENDFSLNHFEIRGGDELYVSSCCQVVLKDAAANVSDYSKMSVLGLHIAAPNAVHLSYYTHTYIHTYIHTSRVLFCMDRERSFKGSQWLSGKECPTRSGLIVCYFSLFDLCTSISCYQYPYIHTCLKLNKR